MLLKSLSRFARRSSSANKRERVDTSTETGAERHATPGGRGVQMLIIFVQISACNRLWPTNACSVHQALQRRINWHRRSSTCRLRSTRSFFLFLNSLRRFRSRRESSAGGGGRKQCDDSTTNRNPCAVGSPSGPPTSDCPM